MKIIDLSGNPVASGYGNLMQKTKAFQLLSDSNHSEQRLAMNQKTTTVIDTTNPQQNGKQRKTKTDFEKIPFSNRENVNATIGDSIIKDLQC